MLLFLIPCDKRVIHANTPYAFARGQCRRRGRCRCLCDTQTNTIFLHGKHSAVYRRMRVRPYIAYNSCLRASVWRMARVCVCQSGIPRVAHQTHTTTSDDSVVLRLFGCRAQPVANSVSFRPQKRSVGLNRYCVGARIRRIDK